MPPDFDFVVRHFLHIFRLIEDLRAVQKLTVVNQFNKGKGIRPNYK